MLAISLFWGRGLLRFSSFSVSPSSGKVAGKLKNCSLKIGLPVKEISRRNRETRNSLGFAISAVKRNRFLSDASSVANYIALPTGFPRATTARDWANSEEGFRHYSPGNEVSPRLRGSTELPLLFRLASSHFGSAEFFLPL